MSKGERTRQHATAVALELATTLGIEQVTIGNVAERSGMSKSGVYAHYGSKAALQIAALEYATERFGSLLFGGLEHLPAGVSRLREFFLRWIGWSAKAGLPGGCPFAAAMFELDDIEGPVRDYIESNSQRLFTFLEGHIHDAVESGELRFDADFEQIAWEISAIYLGHHTAQRFSHNPDADRRATAAFEGVIDRHRRG